MSELTLKQVLEALVRGEEIQDRDGDRFKLDESRNEIIYSHVSEASSECIKPGAFYFETVSAPFTIHKPEPKRLSFDEAVSLVGEGHKVAIGNPTKGAYSIRMNSAQYINMADLNALDIAERRGWAITLVEEGT